MSATAAPTGEQLRRRLRGIGLSAPAVSAAWPSWWSDDANGSASARAELAFTVARRLGLDPRSLIEEGEAPQFLWKAEARFKRMSDESELQREGITSFAHSVGAALVDAMPALPRAPIVEDPGQLREQLIRDKPFVGLPELVAYVWSAGIPAVHLRVFPWEQKRIAAMTVRLGDRWAVMTGRDATDPASLAFYIAHELGHVALGQVPDGFAVVDLDDAAPAAQRDDGEERAADEFALHLLAGESNPRIQGIYNAIYSGAELAAAAQRAAPGLRIDPGLIALIFGRTTGQWGTTTTALRALYPAREPAWAGLNAIARQQLDLNLLAPDRADFVSAVISG